MADIGDFFLGGASVERVGADVEETGGGVVVEVAAVASPVASVLVTVVAGVGCETDGCECDAKCGGFVDTAEGIIDVLKMK